MRLRYGSWLAGLVLTVACSGGSDGETSSPGGSGGAGGSGLPQAGTASGGSSATAGSSSGGGTANHGGTGNQAGTTSHGGSNATAGASDGGTNQGGTNQGGTNQGGTNQGGTNQGGTNQGGSGGSGNGGGFKLPPANASFDYQIGGAYTPPNGVKVVSRDRGDAPAAGIYNICYVNGFQAQQSDNDMWLNQYPDLVLRDGKGDPVVDPDWDEMLLDTSTAEKRQGLAAIVGGWIQGCAKDGFDAVEIDNLDSYSRSGGKLSQANNVAFMKLLSDVGHQAGLAMGQKNSTELVGSAKSMGTDFAVAEECNRYSECGDYKAGYGDLVFVIEYRDQDFDAGCKAFPELSIVRRDVNVTTPGSATYVYKGC